MVFQTPLLSARVHAAAFTLVEIIIVLAILGILAGIGIAQYTELREVKRVEQVAETLVADLESTRADALAGRSGQAHGIKFYAQRYVQFVGDTYPGTGSLATTTLDARVELSTTLPGDETIVFDRLDGAFGATATITAALANDHAVYKQIVVTPRGVVQLVE